MHPAIASDLRALRAIAASDPAAEREAAARHELELLADDPDSRSEAEIRTILGTALVDLSRYKEACVELRRGRDLAAATGADEVRLRALGQLAIATYHLGDLDEATAVAEDGWQLADDLDRPDRAWRFANTQAAIHLRRAEYTAALDRYQAALELEHRLGDQEAEATLLNNISVAEMYIGDYPKALATLERAKALREQLGNPAALADVIANVGDVLHLMGDEEGAIERHREALELRQATGVPERIALSHHSLGAALARVGRREEARTHLEAALDLERHLELRPEIAATLSSLALLYADLGYGELAVETAREGIKVSDEVGMPGRKLGNLDALAWAQEAAGDLTGALETARDARRLAEEIKTEAGHTELAALQAKLEAREAQHRIDVLEKQSRLQALSLRNRTLQRDALIAGLLLVLAVGGLGWNSFRVTRNAHRFQVEANARIRAQVASLEAADHHIRRLEGLLPICSACKSIRDTEGSWRALESYLSDHSDVTLTHGLCPDCCQRLYPELY